MRQLSKEEIERQLFHEEHWQVDGYCKCGNHIYGIAEVCYRCNTKKLKADRMDEVSEYIKEKVYGQKNREREEA